MQELSKVFKGIEIKVDIIDDRNMMFDISGIAAKFNKRVSRWKQSSSDYIKTVQKCTDLKETDLIIEVGNSVKIHNKLFIDFARYVSVEFAVEADNIIYDILTGKSDVIQKQISFKNNILKEKDKQITKLSESTYEKVRGFGYETVFRII